MKRDIRKVAVLGAGTMGAGIAAHLANASVRTLLLAPHAREAIARLPDTEPAPLFLPELTRWIEPGDLEGDLPRLAETDWVIEALPEDAAVKQAVLERVDRFRRPGTIVSTATCGLPVAALARGRSADFRRHWLGTHFLHPVRQVRLVEVVPGEETLPEVLEEAVAFLDRNLGKGVVRVHDTPGFVAHRIGLFTLATSLRLALAEDWDVVDVDALTGPLVGHAQSATFRAIDSLGVDTFARMLRQLHERLPDDEERDVFRVPPLLEEMERRGWLGAKSGQGFYRRAKDREPARLLVLDWRRMEYAPVRSLSPALVRAAELDELGSRLRFLLRRPDRVGHFAWELLRAILRYSARRVPETAGDLGAVDLAMRWGFGWSLGPFELWDELGVKRLARRMAKEGREVPPLAARLVASGRRSFYQRRAVVPRVMAPSGAAWRPVLRPPGVVRLAEVRAAGRVVRARESASLLDLGQGVACLALHAPHHTIERDTLALLRESLGEVDRGFEGLLIASEGEHFSVGVNLRELLALARARLWMEIERGVREFQELNLLLRYSTRPVVVAPAGLTLGGGCEMALAADRTHAAAETWMGLVETNIGLIPAGGGTKELLLRHLDRRPAGTGDPYPLVELAFHTIFRARVSANALEARQLLYLGETDPVTLNADRLVAEAAGTVRALARGGSRPPLPREEIPALGDAAVAALRRDLERMERAGRLSAHDRLVGERLARVLAGGEGTGERRVSERQLLDLEREAFLGLIAEPRTQERIEYTLRTGQRLRN